MKVAVTGGREYADTETVYRTLDAIHAEHGITDLAHGGAAGADAIARAWAFRQNVHASVFVADWREQGKAAGPIRNFRMLLEHQPELLVAFPGGRGTANCTSLARQMGINVQIVERDA